MYEASSDIHHSSQNKTRESYSVTNWQSLDIFSWLTLHLHSIIKVLWGWMSYRRGGEQKPSGCSLNLQNAEELFGWIAWTDNKSHFHSPKGTLTITTDIDIFTGCPAGTNVTSIFNSSIFLKGVCLLSGHLARLILLSAFLGKKLLVEQKNQEIRLQGTMIHLC